MTFDAEAFNERFSRFMDEVIPDELAAEMMTVDEMAGVLRRVRDFMDAEEVPLDLIGEFGQMIVRPFIASHQPISDAERAEVRAILLKAIGVDVSFPN